MANYRLYNNNSHRKYLKDIKQKEKRDNILSLLIFLLVAGFLGFFIWFFGWRAYQGEVIKERPPIIKKIITE